MKLPSKSTTEAPPETRVLLFDHTASLGGGEIALANLVGFLDRKRFKALVVLASDGPLAERLRPIAETYVMPLSRRVVKHKKDKLGITTLFRLWDELSVLVYVGRLVRFIKLNKIDVVHTNSLKADIIGGLAGRLAGRPVVWHVRDRIEDDYLPKLVVRAFRWLSRAIPDYVIGNSAATLSTLHLGTVVPGTAIPSGIDLRARSTVVHDGTSPGALRERNDKPSVFHIGLIGRISPWKGQHIFIKAAAQVHKHFPKARFLIIGAALFGEDDYEQEVRQLPAQLGIEDIVEFTGFCHDTRNAIANLDLVVHASTKGEPFGQVIIEGMAAGKPVVATNGGGVPEIVEDGKTGILVPMGDVEAMVVAICQILADPTRAKAMGTCGRQRIADHFTLEQTARRVEAVYQEISR
jgi:glycosyltransferase involved in cell wall biosynthesis